jgi:cytochrome c oxidase assembly factor CtaG
VLGRLFRYSLVQCQQTVAGLLAFAGLRFESMLVVLAAFKAWQRQGGVGPTT